MFAAAPKNKGTSKETQEDKGTADETEETGVLADTSHLLERDTWSLKERGEDNEEDGDEAKVFKKSNGD